MLRLEKEAASDDVHDTVQTQRENETERQEITKNFMQMREERLRQESVSDKNYLSTQMIQVYTDYYHDDTCTWNTLSYLAIINLLQC